MRESATSGYGLHQAEFLAPTDPHFLRAGHANIPPRGLVFQLTEESQPIGEFHGRSHGDGIVIVEAQDEGGYHEQGIRNNQVTWEP